MQNTKYVFQVTPYDMSKLLSQVSKALEKRTELVSRERYPGLWKHTDKFNMVAQGRTRSRLGTRVKSIVCLALGFFLFVPSLVKPQELLVPLLAGVIAIGAGIGGLWRSRKHKKNPFDKSAKLLLEGKDTISTEQSVAVSFSEAGMTIPTKNNHSGFVSYANFECIIETDDVFLCIYDERVTVLQKSDLTMGNISGFRDG